MPPPTEREKMLAGHLYNSQDPELTHLRATAKRQTREYNLHIGYEDDPSLREAHLARLLGAMGCGANVEPPFRVDYGANIHIGDNFYANFDVVILDCAKVTIGDNVLLGPGVQLYTATHPLDVETRHGRGLESAQPITIGSNVWMGGNAVVLPGVTVGDGAVVGAAAVVTRDVPPYSLVVGNPARVIRKLS